MWKTTSAAVAALAALTVCAGSDTDARILPPLGRIPVISSPDQITLPIDRYEPTPAQAAELNQASEVATAACMRSYGLPSAPDSPARYSHSPDPRMRSGAYGVFAPGLMPARGYEVGPDLDGQSPDAALSATARAVINGRDASGIPVRTYYGAPVPPGGCRRVGLDAIGGGLPAGGAALPDSGPRIPARDPRLLAVNARWSHCMARKGYGYDSPEAASFDQRWRSRLPAHTAQEIATATADLACKRATNLVGVAVAVEAAYDERYIAAHRLQLAQFQRQLSDRLTKAAAIIADNGSAA